MLAREERLKRSKPDGDEFEEPLPIKRLKIGEKQDKKLPTDTPFLQDADASDGSGDSDSDGEPAGGE